MGVDLAADDFSTLPSRDHFKDAGHMNRDHYLAPWTRLEGKDGHCRRCLDTRNMPASVVDQEDLLAAHIKADTEIGIQRTGDQR